MSHISTSKTPKLIAPTDKELFMTDDEFIISMTDLKGKIVYGNRTFFHYSGYTENQLLGQSHNIIRHPEMPRAIYKLLWNTIQSEQEFFGYVKNMCKDGSFYWTFANITMNYDEDKNVVGYYSARRKPHPERIKFFSSLYQKMCEIEKQFSSSLDAMSASNQFLSDALQGKEYEALFFTG